MWESERHTWPNHEWSRFVVAGGLRWHLQQAGRGPVLLLVHGTGASTHSWRALLPLLAEHYTVVAPDLPGHGFSGAADGAHCSIGGMSECFGALLDALGAAPQYCVGHSAGAVLVCRLALDGRINPRAIVSLNGAFLPPAGAAGRLFSPLARLLASGHFVPRLVASSAGNPTQVARLIAGTGSRLDPVGVDLYTRLVRRPEHVAGALAMMANWNLRGFARQLGRLGAPLELIVADNDRTVPPEQALSVQQQVATGSIHRLAGLGHLAHEEQPARVAQLILDICRAHPG